MLKINPWILSTILASGLAIDTVIEGLGYVPIVNQYGQVTAYEPKGVNKIALGILGTTAYLSWKKRHDRELIEQQITLSPEAMMALEQGIITSEDLPLDLSRYPIYVPEPQPKPATSDRLIDEIIDWDASIIFAATTGCGKTTLLLNALKALMGKRNDIDFLICDPKQSRWLGLENRKGIDGQPIVIYPEFTRTVIQFKERLDWCLDELSRRKAARRNGKAIVTPLILIVDEWPSLKKYIDLAKQNKEIDFSSENIISMLELIILQGREDKVTCWFIAQGHQCNTLGFTGDVRGNTGVVALSSDKKFETIEAVKDDSYFIKSKSDRDRIEAEYVDQKYLNNKPQYLYFSSLTHQKYIARSPFRDDAIKTLDLFKDEQTPEPITTIPDYWED